MNKQMTLVRNTETHYAYDTRSKWSTAAERPATFYIVFNCAAASVRPFEMEIINVYSGGGVNMTEPEQRHRRRMRKRAHQWSVRYGVCMLRA